MIRLIYFFIIGVTFLTSCTSVNKNPDILLKEPYSKVKYIADPDETYKTIEVVQIETRGVHANIMNTLPLLYKKALDYSKNLSVMIGSIEISSYTKLEDVQVPYQVCQSVSRMVSVPSTSCFNGSCTTSYSYQNQMVQECKTQYRTEARNVLYQVASAEIIDRKDD